MPYFPQRSADIKAIVRNNRPSKNNIYSGYRPAFKVKNNYFTTGIIKFIDCDELSFENEAVAEVWFITPEAYPNCLEIGQIIPFQEGKFVCGNITITKINNKILEKAY